MLQISYHRLEGRLVKLTRPIAVLEKRQRPAHEPGADADVFSSPPRSSSPSADMPGSPLPLRKRARSRTPEAAPKRGAAHARDMRPSAESSSPMPERTLRYSDGHLDFSSPARDSGMAAHAPSTAYEVTTIVRQKLLFSQRPEPIVKLD